MDSLLGGLNRENTTCDHLHHSGLRVNFGTSSIVCHHLGIFLADVCEELMPNASIMDNVDSAISKYETEREAARSDVVIPIWQHIDF